MCADPTGSATRLSDEHKSKKKKWITGRIHCCFPVEPGLWEVELGCVGVRPDGGRGDLPAQVLLLLTSISLLLLLLTWTRLLITVYSLCFPSPQSQNKMEVEKQNKKLHLIFIQKLYKVGSRRMYLHRIYRFVHKIGKSKVWRSSLRRKSHSILAL